MTHTEEFLPQDFSNQTADLSQIKSEAQKTEKKPLLIALFVTIGLQNILFMFPVTFLPIRIIEQNLDISSSQVGVIMGAFMFI
jgi:xanthine/uracil permease